MLQSPIIDYHSIEGKLGPLCDEVEWVPHMNPAAFLDLVTKVIGVLQRGDGAVAQVLVDGVGETADEVVNLRESYNLKDNVD